MVACLHNTLSLHIKRKWIYALSILKWNQISMTLAMASVLALFLSFTQLNSVFFPSVIRLIPSSIRFYVWTNSVCFWKQANKREKKHTLNVIDDMWMFCCTLFFDTSHFSFGKWSLCGVRALCICGSYNKFLAEWFLCIV